MNLLLRIIITSIVAFGLSYLLEGIRFDQFTSAVLVAILLALLNAFIRPVLILLTLPITVFTLGLFLFVINAIIILIAAELVNGFVVDGFWWALLFSLLLSIVSSLLYNKSRRKE